MKCEDHGFVLLSSSNSVGPSIYKVDPTSSSSASTENLTDSFHIFHFHSFQRDHMSIPSIETTQFESPMESDSDPPPSLPPLLAAESEPTEPVYRTKVIQFFGRNTPIILQKDNGPCPLLAICNILSLKNNLKLSADKTEVPQETLVQLVANQLLGQNTRDDGVDEGITKNWEQNVEDAIDTLPRLTTGIDVNVKFRRIDDFEFTSELSIFDLLDIPLYHGWIIDPQDRETADAIGSKSYNTLMGELVSLESRTMESDKSELKEDTEDDTVDFAAATTAALGVPSPSLSRGQSLNESLLRERKGDIEEEAELLRILKLSAEDRTTTSAEGIIDDMKSQGSVGIESLVLPKHLETVDLDATENKTSVCDGTNTGDMLVDKKSPEVVLLEDVCLLSKDRQEIKCDQAAFGKSTEVESVAQKTDSGAQVENHRVQTPCFGEEPVASSDGILSTSLSDKCAQNESNLMSEVGEPRDLQNDCKLSETNILLADTAVSSSTSQSQKIDESEAFTANGDSSEPIYEGEERMLDSGTSVDYENREPVYEGEVVLAEQMDHVSSKGGMSIRQGELIRNFMTNNASQLTIHGLFCLQEHVKEHELCVFFRNNHFNTMFKHEGDLYILATDQGYLSQPDLVWEKLNEVNGDTIFMTGSFKEFKVGGNSNGTWDEQDALASTADYLANFKIEDQESSSFNSDLQLALALQQQEFEQQQQQQHSLPESAPSGSSRMVTGPQVSRPSGKYSESSSKQELKSKEKCTVM